MSYESWEDPKSPHRGCFFCGATPRSHEHIIPNWINKAIPEWNRSSLRKHEHGGPSGTLLRAKSFDRSLLRQTVKETCEACNNGWMSELEGHVKPQLERLLSFDQVLLASHDMHSFRRWAIKTHMMRTQLDRKGFPFPQAHKDAIRNNHPIPEGWDLWIAPVWVDGVSHRNWSVLTEAPGHLPSAVSQTTLILRSFALVTTFVSDFWGRMVFLDFARRQMAELNAQFNPLEVSRPTLVSPITGMVTLGQAKQVSDFMRVWTNGYLGFDAPELHGDLI